MLGSEDLANLLDDPYQLSLAGQLSIISLLDLTSSLPVLICANLADFTLQHDSLAGISGTALGSEDLAGLLDDAYQLSRAGQLSITVFLDLMSSLAKRPEPLVSAWQIGASPLVQIYQSLSMQDGEASCASQWATFVGQNISAQILANVTAGTFDIFFSDPHKHHCRWT